MIFARSITAALGGLALVLTGMGAGAAAPAAEPEFFFSPSKPWSAARAQGDHCAMHSQYNNGYVLSFEGTGSGDQATAQRFSIDFLQNIFEPGKTYPLGLSQNGGKTIALQGKAITASVIEAPMARRNDFVSSLGAARSLDVSVEGNKFRFFLQGMNSAAADFGDCMAQASMPAGQPASQPAPVESASAAASPAPAAPAQATPAKDIEPVPAMAVGEMATAKPLLGAEEKPPRVKMTTPPMSRVTERIKGEADFTAYAQTNPAAGDELPPAKDIKAGTYAARIAELEKRLNTLQKENKSLSEELSLALEEGKTEHKSIASENWSLERATMRFQEAERQIKKLGLQVQMERAQCDQEKKDLEAMLFDPAVTNQQQLARLADLEQQLQDAREEIANMRLHANERERIQGALPTP